MIKEIQQIQHLDYRMFSLVKKTAIKIGAFYFRMFENACHVQRKSYTLLGSKLVFTISSYSEIEIYVVNVGENNTIKLVDYYKPISKMNNDIMFKIIEKFLCCESCEEYSELKEYLGSI